jgi:cell shape-determining protein MreC
MTEIITSLIGVIGSFAGTLVGIVINSKLTNYRIEQLEKKVDKHNHVVERVYQLEKSEAVFKEDLKVVNHRVEDLEGYHK